MSFCISYISTIQCGEVGNLVTCLVLRHCWLKFSMFLCMIFVHLSKNLNLSSKWNDMRNIVINELLKSNAFTRKELEEAPK